MHGAHCMPTWEVDSGQLVLASLPVLSATFKWLSKLSLTQQCFCIHTRSSFYNVFWAADLGIQCLLFTCASWFEKGVDSFEKKHDVRVFLALAFSEIIAAGQDNVSWPLTFECRQAHFDLWVD